MTDGQEINKLRLIIKKFEELVTEKEQQIENVKKEADELMMKKIDHYEKELAFVREDASSFS